MKLFNLTGNGSEEIVAAVGLISNGITFDKWEPLIPFGIRDLTAIIGREPVEAVAKIYESGEIDPDFATVVKLTQQAVAFFTWLKIIPTLDAQHDEAGRSRRLGENEKGLTSLQEFKDEENILRLAYEATDALIEALDAGGYEFWINSAKYKQREGLILRNKEDFDKYYVIGSHRLFVTLLPMIREVQQSDVAPILGRDLTARLLGGDEEIVDALYDTAARSIALLAMKKAVERLPVEVLPEGVVQVQQSQPMKQRLKAEKEARQSVAASLGNDASRYLRQLQDLVAALTAPDVSTDYHVSRPIVHSKGMTF